LVNRSREFSHDRLHTSQSRFKYCFIKDILLGVKVSL
jgi:hypothetical protein